MATKREAIVVDGIHTNLIEPNTGKSVNYKEVSVWYDGTPMTNAKCDGNLYRRKGTVFVRKVIDKDGELFLEKDTMAQMRALTAYEILLLKAGVYKGVRLNGYYSKLDTPAPIEYTLSNTTETDDGGSVIEVGGIKLEHKFKEGVINVLYYGCILDGTSDNTERFQKIANLGGVIRVPKGRLAVTDSILINSNTVVEGISMEHSEILWKDNSVSPGHTSDENFLLRVISKENITFRNITLNANGSGQADIFRNSILELRGGSKQVNIENVRFKDAYDTNWLGGFAVVSWYGGCSQVTAKNCYFEDIGQSDFGLFEGEDWQIDTIFSYRNLYMPINIETSASSFSLKNINVNNVYVYDCARSAVSVIYNSVSSGTLENVNISNIIGVKVSSKDKAVGGIRFRGGKSVNISNVVFYDIGGTVINMTVDSGQPVQDVSISDIVVSNITTTGGPGDGGFGIIVQGTSSAICKNLSFSNITINNPLNSGVICNFTDGLSLENISVNNVRGTGRGIQINDCSNVNINSNTVKAINNVGIGLLNSKNCNLLNNKVINASGQGINVSGTSDNVSIVNNRVYDDRSTKLTTTGIRVESSLADLQPQIQVFNNNLYGISNPTIPNMLSIASNVNQTKIIQIGNFYDSPFKNATPTVKGLVNQAITLGNISVADVTPVTTPDAADAGTTQALVNEIKAKLNLAVTLLNAVKKSQNDELTNQRTAGQQAP